MVDSRSVEQLDWGVAERASTGLARRVNTSLQLAPHCIFCPASGARFLVKDLEPAPGVLGLVWIILPEILIVVLIWSLVFWEIVPAVL